MAIEMVGRVQREVIRNPITGAFCSGCDAPWDTVWRELTSDPVHCERCVNCQCRVELGKE